MKVYGEDLMKECWLKSILKGFAVAVVFCLMGMGTGCELSDEESGGGGGGDFEGVWALSAGDTVTSSVAWYAHFKSDGSFFISDNADGSAVRVTGTYSVSDGFLVGPFTNPGVGEGRVEATINGGVMNLDFIEYWHTPNKVVPYAGKKI